jgi:hypothetical protein
VSLEYIERLPTHRYLKYRDHFRDHLDYQEEAIEKAKEESDSE